MSGYQSFAFTLTDERITRVAQVWDPAHIAAQLGAAL
jgi:hypothetical protein